MKSTPKNKNAQLNIELSSEEIIEIGNRAFRKAAAVTEYFCAAEPPINLNLYNYIHSDSFRL